ncbi:tetratricopeptide repeat protein [Baaleninema sp.]|uniref:tetratricopeptide repeat protein n=1 Tax=Baaleninema sp. TaxID=3101197 RepID=UPI003D06EF92
MDFSAVRQSDTSGNFLRKSQDLQAEVSRLKREIQENPEAYSLYEKLGGLLEKLQNKSAAMTAYQIAVRLGTNTANTFFRIGFLYQKQERYRDAIPFYFKCLQFQPKSWMAIANLSSSYFGLKNYDKSLEYQDLLKKVDRDRVNTGIYQLLGKHYLETSQFSKAVRCCQSSLELAPNANSYTNLGIAYRKLGDLEKSIESYRQSLKIDPDSSWTHFSLGNVLSQSGQNIQALESYKKALILYPSRIEIHERCGVVELRLGNLESALNYYIKYLGFCQDNYKIYQAIARIFQQKGQKQAAQLCLQGKLPPQIESKIEHFNATRWESSKLSAKSFDRYSIYEPEVFQMSPPKTVDRTLHPTFRSQKRYLPENFVLKIPNGQALYHFDTSISTSDKQLVSDVSSARDILRLENQTPNQHINGRVAFIPLRLGENYYHWTFDILPRLHLLRKAGFDWNSLNAIVVNPIQFPFQRQSLEALNIDISKIRDANGLNFTADELLVPTLIGDVTSTPTKWICEFLREMFLPNPHPQPTQRIYLRRQNTKYRRVLNEEEVIRFVGEYGFKPVSLEQLSVREQVQTLATAEAVVAPHGAGNTNLVYCAPDTPVVEIFAPDYVVDYYWAIADRVGLDYAYLLADDPATYHLSRGERPPQYFGSHCQDIVVNLEALEAILKKVGVDRSLASRRPR